MTSESRHVGPMVKNPERPRIVAQVQHRRHKLLSRARVTIMSERANSL